MAVARATYGRSCSANQPAPTLSSKNRAQRARAPEPPPATGAHFCLPIICKPFSEKVRPCAHPLEALQNPGWSAQRHRRGRRCEASQLVQPQAPASRLSPSKAASKRRGGPDASPSGGPQLSLRSMRNLPGDRPEKLLRRCPCSAQRSTQAARAALTPGRRAHRAFYWPAGRENPSLSARLGNHPR